MAEDVSQRAPHAPGLATNWCNGAKQMIGTSLGPARVWFTIGKGILNEVYYPRVDIPQIRDLGFIISDNRGFWIELKEIPECDIETPSPGIPAVTITHRHKRFIFTQRIVAEPSRDALLIEVLLSGDKDLVPYVLIAPHLGGTGHDNIGEAGAYRGRRVLWAEQGPFGLTLVAADGKQADAFAACSAGYSGVSDGWQDFNRNGRMLWRYQKAGPGNIALMGELPSRATLSLAFGSSKESAATLAISALYQPFELIWDQQCKQWQDWLNGCIPRSQPDPEKVLPEALYNQLKTSAMVLRTHHDKTFRGAMVASLSVPWGEHAEERPGYHLVWPRDLAECAGALLALGAEVEAREILRYLIATQLANGSWFQNQWLGGKPYWTGIQLDQIAFPVLLAGTLAENDMLDGIEVSNMIHRALGFILANGPVSPQDRWEEDSGVNTFTLAVCIAALVTGAQFLPAHEEGFVLEMADYWNRRLEDWTAVFDTPLARKFNVNGYYLRITPADALHDATALARNMPIKNHKITTQISAQEQLGVDFLQLVRFGLRSADDPLIRDTLKLIDATLKVDLPQGPCWHRYTNDGYGEHKDGSPYDGSGHGRLWPLLTGERGHYEVARGSDALPYLRTMAALAGQGSMIPEQVWDNNIIPGQHHVQGQPTGSAMPLAWAHAEYVKLAYSILKGKPVDRPDPLWARYHAHRPEAGVWYWTPQVPIRKLPAHVRLGFCLPWPAVIHWKIDDERTYQLDTRESALGVHLARLPVIRKGAKSLNFRFATTDIEQEEFAVKIYV